MLEDIQVTAAGLKMNSTRSAQYDEFGIDLLSDRRKVHLLTLFYKIVQVLAPNTYRIPTEFTYTICITAKQICFTSDKNNCFMNSFFPSTIKFWIELSLPIRILPTVF